MTIELMVSQSLILSTNFVSQQNSGLRFSMMCDVTNHSYGNYVGALNRSIDTEQPKNCDIE